MTDQPGGKKPFGFALNIGGPPKPSPEATAKGYQTSIHALTIVRDAY